MKTLFALMLALPIVACGSGSTTGSSGGTSGNSTGSSGSTGGSGQCNMTVTGLPHSGTAQTCTAADRGNGYMQLGMSAFPGCVAGQPCALSVVVPAASGTVDCPPTGSINMVSYEETDANGDVSAQGWTGCGAYGDGGACVEQGTCTVNVTSFELQGTNAGGAFGHFSGTITAHLVPNPGLPNGSTMDVSANGSW